MSGNGRFDDWGEALSAQVANWILAYALLALALTCLVVVATLKEIPRIYAERGFAPTTTARVLWLALVGLVVVWLLSALLIVSPATVALAAYLVSWSFLVFVVVVEGCDLYQRRFDPPKTPQTELGLDDVLVPFEFPGTPPRGNGGERELVGLLGD